MPKISIRRVGTGGATIARPPSGNRSPSVRRKPARRRVRNTPTVRVPYSIGPTPLRQQQEAWGIQPNPLSNTSPGVAVGVSPTPGPGGGSSAPGGRVRPERPPRLPTSQAEIIHAREVYEQTRHNLDNEIYQAALNYGDPTTLNQFSAIGPTVTNPNSTLERILRAERLGLNNVANRENAGNTFFSSLRLGGQQRVADEAGRQRSQAYESFERAYRAYTENLARSRMEYDEAVRMAEARDTESWLNEPPEPTGEEGGDEGPGDNGGGSASRPGARRGAGQRGGRRSVRRATQPQGLGTRIYNAGRASSGGRSRGNGNGGAAPPRRSVRRRR
jgi:hypothetical protein